MDLVSPGVGIVLAGGALASLVGGYAWLQRRYFASPQTLSQATAETLHQLLLPLLRGTLGELVDQEGLPRSVDVRELAHRVYDLLPGTLYVRHQGKAVPVPIKVLLGREAFVDLLDVVYGELRGNQVAFEQQLGAAFAVIALKGITEEHLLSVSAPSRSPW